MRRLGVCLTASLAVLGSPTKAEPASQELIVSEGFAEGPMVITPVPPDARLMRAAEIRLMLRDRILLTEFPRFENLRIFVSDGAESEIEFFHAGGKWRLPGHWVRWRVGRYKVAHGELCVAYVDDDGSHRHCRALYRASDGAVYSRATSEDGKRYDPSEKPALRAWTEPFSWFDNDHGPYGHEKP